MTRSFSLLYAILKGSCAEEGSVLGGAKPSWMGAIPAGLPSSARWDPSAQIPNRSADPWGERSQCEQQGNRRHHRHPQGKAWPQHSAVRCMAAARAVCGSQPELPWDFCYGSRSTVSLHKWGSVQLKRKPRLCSASLRVQSVLPVTPMVPGERCKGNTF